MDITIEKDWYWYLAKVVGKDNYFAFWNTEEEAEFLKRNGMDKSQMSAKELSIARSAMKAEQESRYT